MRRTYDGHEWVYWASRRWGFLFLRTSPHFRCRHCQRVESFDTHLRRFL